MESAVTIIGERPSVEAVYRADSDRLWRSLYAFTRDAEIANDAVAEAFAQLIARGDAVRDPQAWTWRAAFRLAAGALKRRGQMTAKVPDTSTPDRYADPDLLSALEALPTNQRAAVVLFYYADLPVSEIARRLGSNGLAVRANLSRGRRRLRTLLGDDHG